MWRYFLVAHLWIGASSLQIPKRKFIRNHANPSSDLRIISRSQASVISKYWLNAIVSYKPMIAKEDQHIVQQINALENHLQQHNLETDLYMAWMPKGHVKEVLVLVVSTIDSSNKTMRVNMLVQSPLWSSDQIKSTSLKKSLETMSDNVDLQINFDDLYDKEPRYKLEWENWI